MKYVFILLLAFGVLSVSAQTNFIRDTGNVSIGVVPAPPGIRLNIQNLNANDQNLVRFVHAGTTNSIIYFGSTSNTYPVINQRNSSILESYRHLRIGAANTTSNIYFETGRTGTDAPVRMMIGSTGNVGIGTESPGAKMHINGTGTEQLASFSLNETGANAFLRITNGTSTANVFYPSILGRAYWPGRAAGISIIGEAEDVLPAGDGGLAAVSIQGRNKNFSALTVNNVLTVNNFTTPLMVVKSNGNVGIGMLSPAYKLAVNGIIGARKVKVTQETWADFVFQDSYKLPSLKEVADYVKENKHLPGIPSAEEVKKDGLDLGDMNAKLLQKVEELTLYLIELKEENESMKARLKALEQK